MDYVLVLAGIVLMILGILGCILPVLPGPPISWAGLLLLNLTRFAGFSFQFLAIFAGVALVVTILDYVVPVWGTKKFGGSKAAAWGSAAGVIIGLFFPPIGIIVGPFLGAFIVELWSGKDSNTSIKAAMGSFIGFLAGAGLKLITSFLMTYYFIKELII